MAVRAEYLVKLTLLALAYYLTGKFGLSLAIPPGFATVIWPPSGIALGALLAHGRRMSPGVFLGSLLINCDIANLWVGEFSTAKLLLCACIASGSTLQALAGHALISRVFGLPLRLQRVSQALGLFAVAGPSACLIASTVGVVSLHVVGNLPTAAMVPNWLSWWVGDVAGIVVFLPLMLALPGGRAGLKWRDRTLRGVHAIGLVLLLLPLGLTFYAWKFFADSAERQSQAHFQTLARESEQAIHTRIASYASATRAGAGMFQSSDHVSRAEWRRFAETIRLREDYPGLMGLGWIERITASQKDEFLARVRADFAPDFRIHPQSDDPLLDVVTYMEPEVRSGATIGLNISHETRRRQAAETAAATGMPTLTRPIQLIQGEEKAAGFLLLQPVYDRDVPLDGAIERRRALRGFVYAPFEASTFLADLTPSQSRTLDIAVTDDGDDAQTIYDGRLARDAAQFSVRRELPMFGQTWIVTWQSTPEFERAEYTNSPLFVLFGGLLFTGLFAVLLIVVGARREDLNPRVRTRSPWLLPVTTFTLMASASVAAYVMLQHAETVNLASLVEGETRRIESELDRSARVRLQALRRMAHRWETSGGTPYLVWRNDARDHVRQVDGLEELQWIGPDFRVQWAEGVRRSGWMENRDIRTNEKFARELAQSVTSGLPLVTEPHESGPGESAFVVYIPLQRDGKFDGFLTALFSSRGFFKDSMDTSSNGAFAFSVRYGGVPYFDNGRAAAKNAAFTRESGFNVDDRRWTFTVSATQGFVDTRQTRLPLFVLLAGLLIAVLSAILVRYVLVARLKASRLSASAAALSTSEERYELAMRGMSVGLWDWEVATNALYLSDKFVEILGLVPGRFSPHYREFSERLHPEDRTTVEAALFGHLRGHNAFDMEFRMRRADDVYVWVHAYGQAKFDAAGHAQRMAGSVQDITQKRLHLQTIQRSESQMRMLVENTPAAVAMFDRDMRCLMASRRWYTDHGIEGREIIGLSHYDVFPEIRGMPKWLDIHQRALRGEIFERREDSWTRADGTTECNAWSIYPWTDPSGQVGGIAMFTEVITAQKGAAAALYTSEEMIRATMEKAPIGKALVRADGRFLRVNPALCQLLGYSERELLAIDFQSITHPEDLGSDLENLRELLDGRVVSYQMEKRYLHRDGRVIWSQLSVSMVRKSNGECDFLVAQIQDITERKALSRMKDEFVSVVSHELRTPLSSIRASLGLINGMHDVDLPVSVKRLVDISYANCERLVALVNDILDLDKVTTGLMPFDLTDESLAYLTQRAVHANEVNAQQLDVRIALEYIDPDIVVYVDDERFMQVMNNLLSNAVKFAPRNSEIEVGAERVGASVRVFVRDHGAGIPEEFRGRIFGKFAQADSIVSRQKGGTGLGLHIARQLVERMNGTIGFVTREGLGTTFWVEFPCVSPDKRRLRVT